MKTVKDACVLKKNALSINVSDQIAQLDQVIANKEEGLQFFARTHITAGLQSLMNEGLARLAGCTSQAIFHLKQAMGGGKTHLLIGMGLLARHPEIRQTICPDLHKRFSFKSAHIAAFNGRIRPKEYFWGEIAKQLGKAEVFKQHWINGIDAPDEAAWLRLFEDNQPTLILLDELPTYFGYYASIPSGKRSQADLMTGGLSTLLTAASKKANVCVIISDLSAAYEEGERAINKALDDARQELGRQEKTIIPVDLTGTEIYEILRKNLFETLPESSEIKTIAIAYGKALEDAGRSNTISRGAEATADEIVATYPFHPRLKNLIALFKENEKFRQTRGLMEFISRLLLSVWKKDANDVFLIGAQHFDFSIPDVRDAFERIYPMREVIARDIWDSSGSAHAQIIDGHLQKRSAQEIASLILTSSLSSSVNAIKGLSKHDIFECLISPVGNNAVFDEGLSQLVSKAWYLHLTTDDLYYFDARENLGKKLKKWAEDAPENQIDALKRERLSELFARRSGAAYGTVLPLPELDEVHEALRRNRVLVICEPDGSIPPKKLSSFSNTLLKKITSVY